MLQLKVIACVVVLVAPAISLCAENPTPNRIYALNELPPQVRKVAARVIAHHKKIVGARTPDDLPIRDLMRRRLGSLAQVPDIGLSAADAQLLSLYEQSEKDVLNDISREGTERFRSICTNRRSMQPSVVIGELIAMQKDEERQSSEYYESLLASLSFEGQQGLRQYLREEIAPRVNKSTVDIAGLAAEMPKQLFAQLEFACTTAPRDPISIETQGDDPEKTPLFGTFGD